MVALRVTSRAGDTLQDLAEALEGLELGPELADLDADRQRLASTIRSYLIPRALDPMTPTMVVFAGPTGSGKSTLINSLTGRNIATTGALRPTTKEPMVLTSAPAAHLYRTVGDVPCRVILGSARVLGSMALVDTPDIDSAAVAHRAAAETLVDNADVLVFVTSAIRYADEVPWQVLRRAAARGVDVINVLNRVGSASSGAVVDFKARLRDEGLDDDLVTVPEHHLPEDGARVPSTSIRSLARRLSKIVSHREQHLADTFDRVLGSVVDQSSELGRRIDRIEDETDSLEAELSIELSRRAPRLYLGGIVDGLYERLDEKGGRWAQRRWVMGNRLEPGEVTARKEKIVARIMANVEGDLRRWLVDEPALGVGPHEIMPQTRPVIRSAAEAWVHYVARIREELDVGEPWLAEAALMDGATDEEALPAAEALFGDYAPILVERARRELEGRLEVVYQHAGSHLLEKVRRGRGSLDISDLRAALGVVSSTLAPLDA